MFNIYLFVLFKDAVSISYYRALNAMLISMCWSGKYLEGSGRDLDRLKNITKIFIEDSWCSDRDLNHRLSEYESEAPLLSVAFRTDFEISHAYLV
jgi:hypothetical protein